MIKKSHRMSAVVDATVIQVKNGKMVGKPFSSIIDRVYSHNDGSITGTVFKNKDKYHVRLNPNTKLWEFGTWNYK